MHSYNRIDKNAQRYNSLQRWGIVGHEPFTVTVQIYNLKPHLGVVQAAGKICVSPVVANNI